jgi:hypothetical protein
MLSVRRARMSCLCLSLLLLLLTLREAAGSNIKLGVCIVLGALSGGQQTYDTYSTVVSGILVTSATTYDPNGAYTVTTGTAQRFDKTAWPSLCDLTAVVRRPVSGNLHAERCGLHLIVTVSGAVCTAGGHGE